MTPRPNRPQRKPLRGDEELLQQVLNEGGLSIETRETRETSDDNSATSETNDAGDAKGAILFRTVIQLDGDVLVWVRRLERDGVPIAGSIDPARAAEHLANVAAQAEALEAALLRLGARAEIWMKRARTVARIGTVTGSASTITAVVGGASPLLRIAAAATTTLAGAATRWGGPIVGRFVLRRFARWLGAKIR